MVIVTFMRPGLTTTPFCSDNPTCEDLLLIPLSTTHPKKPLAPIIATMRPPLVLLIVLSLGEVYWHSFCSDAISTSNLDSVSITEPEEEMLWLVA